MSETVCAHDARAPNATTPAVPRAVKVGAAVLALAGILLLRTLVMAAAFGA